VPVPKDFRVLLVNCNTPMDNLIPAGISLISAVLRAEGIEVRLFDTTFYKPPGALTGDEARTRTLQVRKTDLEAVGIRPKPGPVTEDFRRLVLDYRPDVIGFSVIEVTYPLSLALARAVADYDRRAPRVFGGVHATFAAPAVIAQDLVDIVCVGEGEQPMRELCRALREGRDPAGIRNLWIKRDGRVVRNPLRGALDLDTLPDQDWEIYERERFWKPMGGRIWVTGTFEMNRGCPYSCLYCVNYGLNKLYRPVGGYYREKAIPVLVREMKEKKARYGLQFAYLVAESFLTTSHPRLARFADLYPREVGLPFWVEARPESVTAEKVRLLEESGCEGISLGVESGNERFREEMMDRRIRNERIVRAFEILARSRLRVSANNVIGFPTETRALIFETIELNRRFPRVDGVMCALYNPYHGTRLREIAVERGYLDPDALAGDYRKETVLRMEHLGPAELLGLQRTFPLYVKFPRDRWEEIRQAEALTPEGDRLYERLAEEYRRRFMS
jgi:anaerobic magnesium-protoporphyrin IX monomethyl ester cyclase